MSVSVIIPAYNAEAYIERCIRSVLEQSYDNLEIIAVNDGSTDGTLEKLTALCSADSRLKIIDKPNEGVVLARLTALNVASGQYLTFLDADDYLPVNSIGSMVAAIETSDADICIGNYTLVWSTGRETLINHVEGCHNAIDCIKYCLKYGEMFLPIKMYKTDLFKKYVDIPSDIIIQEDTIGVIQYLSNIQVVSTTTESVYFYYKHTDSVTSIVSQQHIASLIKVSRFLESCSFKAVIPRQIELYRGRILKSCLRYASISPENKSTVKEIYGKLRLSVRIEIFIQEIISMVKYCFKKICKSFIVYE